ncbi:sensor histidine kinase [Lutibacter sp.]|uniref:sensor histidine kinase n=1 Tax=Lutibacter sp. TaxID=1925666 RepID=UPI003562C47E
MELKEKIGFYKVCFDSMQAGILVFNDFGEIVIANTPISIYFEYSTYELQNLKVCTLFKDCSVFKNFQQNPEKKKFKSLVELTGVKKSGAKLIVEASFGKISYEGNNYFKLLLTDITRRKKKEIKIQSLNVQLEEEVKLRNIELESVVQKLRKSLSKEKELNFLKTKFIALASHEFKTPLAAILSSTELMAKYSDLDNVEKRNEHLKKIKSMISHLNHMLDDLLTLENIEAGEINLSLSNFKLSDLIKNISANTKPFLKKKQQLIFENEQDCEIYHDNKIITIILKNLIYNAIKYSNEKETIKVCVLTNKRNIYFTIEDHGIGIPISEQNLIFNRFFRAKNALYYPGTGIGLNIVKGYVQNLNGTISFESVENKGTIFKVQLPKMNNNHG